MSASATATSNLFQSIPLDRLAESATNPRRHYNQVKLNELAENVKEHGVLVPLLARPDKKGYEIIAGSRRFRAAKLAKLADVPVRIVEMTDQQVLEVQLIENLQREDVHPLEEAEGFERLLKVKGYTVGLLAERVGRDESYIYKRLQLAKLIEPLKKAFLEERIQIGHAVILARLQPDQQKQALKEVLFERSREWMHGSKDVVSEPHAIAVTRLDTWVRAHVYLDLSAAPWKKDDAALVPKAGACTTCPKRTGSNLALFDDLKKGDMCLDPECYAEKGRAQLVAIETKATAAGEKLVRVVTSWADGPQLKKLNALASHNFQRVTPKRKCKHAEKALVVGGQTEVGQVIEICRTSSCEVHHHFGSGSTPGPKTFAQIWTDRRKKLDAKIELEVRRTLWREIVEETPEEFNRPEMDLIARTLIYRAGHDGRQAICGALGIEGKKRPGDRTGYDYRAPLEAYVKGLEGRQMPGFMLGVAMYAELVPSPWGPSKDMPDLMKAAGLYEVNVTALRKRVASPFLADFEKRKAKAQASQKAHAKDKKAAAAKKDAPGVCRECGCTEEDCSQCIEKTGEPCSWANKEKTLCTACA